MAKDRGSTIGRAYVQIMPSMKGLGKSLSAEFGGAAEKAGNSAGNKLVSAIKGALVAAGIGTALKATITEGAALQQSIGGIETLYGEASDKMKKYADDAFKSAGLSANAYMETATGFAAGLVASVGGDTQKAADAANQAIIDMADNANKMGTDMQSIQNAYQGFAKQNYTMLDNLKLGYGGTKSEMERLLADAQKLTGVKYDLDNLADVYEAIHVIQENLAITGTTAKEAATTFSGSFAAMKAAAKNTLGKLALGEDIKPSLNALSETASTFLVGNLLPMAGKVLSGIPQLVSGAIKGLSKNGGQFIAAGRDLVKDFAKSIVENGPTIRQSIGSLLVELAENIKDFDWHDAVRDLLDGITKSTDKLTGGGYLLKAGLSLVSAVADGVLAAAPEFISRIPDLLDRFLTGLEERAGILKESGLPLVKKIADGIIDNAPEVLTSLGEMAAIMVTHIASDLPELLDCGWELLKQIGAGIIEHGDEILTSLKEAVETAMNAVFESSETLSAMRDWLAEHKPLVEGLAVAVGVLTAAVVAYNVAQAIQNAGGIVYLAQLGATAVGVGALSAAEVIATAATTAFGAVMAFVTSPITLVILAIGALVAAIVVCVKHWDDIKLAAVEAWETIKQAFGKVGEWFRQHVYEPIVNVFSNAWSAMSNVGNNLVKGLWNGIQNVKQWILNKISSFCSGIVDGIKGFFGIHSPSTVFAGIGEMLDAGLALGITEGAQPIKDAIDDVNRMTAKRVNTSFEITGRVNSVSSAEERSGNGVMPWGGVTIIINGVQGQDVNELADLVSARLEHLFRRREASLT